MRRFLRWGLLGLAVALVWLLAALVWFKYQVRSGLTRARIEEVLAEAWGRPGKVEGLRLAGLRRIEIQGLSVSGPTGLENLMRADALAIDVSWSSILGFSFAPERLVILRPCIRLVKEDWKSWWPADKLIGHVGTALGSFRPPSMTLSVEGGSLLFEDRSSDEVFRWSVEGIDFSLSPGDWSKELRFRHPLKVPEGEVEVSGSLVPRSLRGTLRFRGRRLDFTALGSRFFRGETRLRAARVDVQGQVDLRGGVDGYEFEWKPLLDLDLKWPFATSARFEGKLTSDGKGTTVSEGLLAVKDLGDFAVTGRIFEFPSLSADLRLEGLGLAVAPLRRQAFRLHPALTALVARWAPEGEVDLLWQGRGSFTSGKIQSSGSLKDVGRLRVRPFGQLQGLRFTRILFHENRLVLGNVHLEGSPAFRIDLEVKDPWGLNPAIEARVGSEGFPAALARDWFDLPYDPKGLSGGIGLEATLRGVLPTGLVLGKTEDFAALRRFVASKTRATIDLRGLRWMRGEKEVRASGKLSWDGGRARGENLEFRAGDLVLRATGAMGLEGTKKRLNAAWAIQNPDGGATSFRDLLAVLPPETAATWAMFKPEGGLRLEGDLRGWRDAWLVEGKGSLERARLLLGSGTGRARVDFGDVALAFNESRLQVLADRLHVEELPVAYDLDVIRYSTGWELRSHLSTGGGTVPPSVLLPFLPASLVERLSAENGSFRGTVALSGALRAPRARIEGQLQLGAQALEMLVDCSSVGVSPTVTAQIRLAEGKVVDAGLWKPERFEPWLGIALQPLGRWSRATLKVEGPSTALGGTLIAEGSLGGGRCRLVGRRAIEKESPVTDLRFTADLPRGEQFLSAFPTLTTTAELWKVGGGLRVDGRCRIEGTKCRTAGSLEVAEAFATPIVAGWSLPLRGLLGRLQGQASWTLGGEVDGGLSGMLTGRLVVGTESFPLEARKLSWSRSSTALVTASVDLALEGQALHLEYRREQLLGGRVHDLTLSVPSFDLARFASLHGRSEGRPSRLVAGTASLALRAQGTERYPELEGELRLRDLRFLAEGTVGEGTWSIPEIRLTLAPDDARLEAFEVFQGSESQPFPLQGSLKGILDVANLWTALRDRRGLLWQRFLARLDGAWGRKTRELIFGKERDVQGRIASQLTCTLRLWIVDRDEPYEFVEVLDSKESEDFGFVFRREAILKSRIEKAKVEVARRQGFKLSGFGVHQDRLIKLRKTEVLVEDERGNLLWPDQVPAWRRPRR